MPLTQPQRATLETALLVRGRQLREEIGEDRLADLNAEPEAAALARDVVELREVESALERMQAGSYGNCTDCAAEIPLPRLQATPWALRCKACQAKAEKP
jgi:DnaK suppressor protein